MSASQEQKVDKWLRSVLWEHHLPGQDTILDVHRSKGRLVFGNGSEKILQGVREIFEILESPEASGERDPSRQGKIILIGRYLDGIDFDASLASELAS